MSYVTDGSLSFISAVYLYSSAALIEAFFSGVVCCYVLLCDFDAI